MVASNTPVKRLFSPEGAGDTEGDEVVASNIPAKRLFSPDGAGDTEGDNVVSNTPVNPLRFASAM